MGTASEERRLVRAMRLRAQGLVDGHRWPSAPDVVRAMLAVQAQDRASSLLAVSLRADDRPGEAAVLGELAAGSITRNRPSRGTIQLTAPEDLVWLSALMAPRSLAAAEQRRERVGVSPELLEAFEGVVRAELADGRTRTRAELVEAAAAAGHELDGGQAGHVMRQLTETTVITFAAPRGSDDEFALVDSWVARSRSLDRDEALAELATRYVGARGPVTPGCLGWWSNLPMADVRRGLAAAGGALEEVELDGVTFTAPAGSADLTTAEVDAALAEPLLLPAFDEYLLGYRSRDAALDDEHATRVVPGRNGMFKPIVVVDGEVVGIWSRRAARRALTVVIEPFPGGALDGAAPDHPALAGLARRAAELAGYLGRSVEAGDGAEVEAGDDGDLRLVVRAAS